MARILSTEEVENMLRETTSISSTVEEITNACEVVYNSFTNEAIVQSFYASGKFGQEQKDLIDRVLKAVKRYYEVINSDDGLIFQTNKYLTSQIELLTNGETQGGGTDTPAGSGRTFDPGELQPPTGNPEPPVVNFDPTADNYYGTGTNTN